VHIVHVFYNSLKEGNLIADNSANDVYTLKMTL